MKRTAVLITALVCCAPAFGSPPPRHAIHSSVSATHERSVLHYLAQGCFQVAAREFVCPLRSP